jgi:hypothetical protein
MSRRKGPAHYIVTTVLIILGIPFGWVIALSKLPTPGIYVFWLFPVTDTGDQVAVVLRAVLCGLVNVFCCYVIIRALVAAVRRLLREKDPATPGGQELN